MASEYDELFGEKLSRAYKWANDELIKHNFVIGPAMELLSAAENMKESEGFMQSLFWDEASGSVLYRRDWFEEMTVQYNSLTDAQEVRRSAPGLFRKMLENGIWLSEQPEYSYYKAGEQKTEEAGTLSAEEFRTLPIDEKVDRAYRWARQYQREHLLIAQMLSLNFDSDTLDDGNGFKISVFCDENNKKTLLRRDWYNDSEIRTRYDRLANAEEIKRVAPKSFALMRDNGLMLCEMALKGEKLSAKTDIVACDMFSAFEKYRSEDPEETLTRMRLFILSCAESFRCGEITEEEFFVKTFVRKDLMDKVIELRGHISLNYYYNVTESDMIGFTTAFKRWKESGELEYRQWMVKMINTKGNVLEDAKWVFRVIDALLIPISSFEVISDKLYTVPIQYLFDGNGKTDIAHHSQTSQALGSLLSVALSSCE